MRVLTSLCVLGLLVSACNELSLAGSIEPATFDRRATVVRVSDDVGEPLERFTLRLVDGTVHEGALTSN